MRPFILSGNTYFPEFSYRHDGRSTHYTPPPSCVNEINLPTCIQAKLPWGGGFHHLTGNISCLKNTVKRIEYVCTIFISNTVQARYNFFE